MSLVRRYGSSSKVRAEHHHSRVGENTFRSVLVYATTLKHLLQADIHAAFGQRLSSDGMMVLLFKRSAVLIACLTLA
jgi:hypothetical protein